MDVHMTDASSAGSRSLSRSLQQPPPVHGSSNHQHPHPHPHHSHGYSLQPMQQQQQQQQSQQQQQQPQPIDMGYEDHAPTTFIVQRRRGSMSENEEKQRRASIKAIMADDTISPMAKRRSIQHLMDGRRNSMDGGARRLSMDNNNNNNNNNNNMGSGTGTARRCSMTGSGGGSSAGGSVHSASNASSLDTPDMACGSGGGSFHHSNHYQHHPYTTAGYAGASDSVLSMGYCDPDAVVDEEGAGGAGAGAGGALAGTAGGTSMMFPVYAISNEQTMRAERTRPMCTHYERNCTIVAPCCGAAFGCRICHDDCPVLPPKFNNGGRRYHRSASLPSSFTSMNGSAVAHPGPPPLGENAGATAKGASGGIGGGGGGGTSMYSYVTSASFDPEETHHNIDRFAIREVICRECFTRQSSKTNNCVSCGIQFGAYYCNICNLWMSDEEQPYHCPDCGFCRVGGADNFRHCQDCGMCIDKTLYESHHCKAGKYRSNCPVCQEYLFSSRSASHEMPCGHAIHWDCFRQLAAHDSRCPVCKKTAETRDRMMPTWNAMAAGVALQPIPPEMARLVSITCNDCEQAAENRAWHFLGVQCLNCSSFNTVVDQIILTGEEAHEFIERMALAKTSQHKNPRRRVNRRRSAF